MTLLGKIVHKESDEYNHFWRRSIWEGNAISMRKGIKVEAVRLIAEEGRFISEVARELGIAQSFLHR